MFTITKVHIQPGCLYKKCLHEGEYILEHKLAKDFFAPNVCVTAIVGQNGAGKSSLLDMIFRILNNLGYCLYSREIRNASDPMSYVEGVRADLHFEMNHYKGCVYCRGRMVAFQFENFRCKFIVETPNCKRPLADEQGFEAFEDYTNPDFKKQKKVAKRFFYLIATNYSLQAYIANDYRKEKTIEVDREKQKNVPSRSIWLNNLFHKNDGYMCPIVLNPMRSEGKIDMTNEEHLTTQRLEAILIEDDEDAPFLQDYKFERVEYYLKPRTIQYGFREWEHGQRLYYTEEEVNAHNEADRGDDLWTYIEDDDLNDFSAKSQDKHYYSYHILKALFCGVKPGMTKLQLALREYVVYKVLSIAEKYPSFSIYADRFNTRLVFAPIPPKDADTTIKDVRNLARRAKANRSHIGIKLNLALNLIYRTNRITDKKQLERLEEPFTYREYAEIFNIPLKGKRIIDRMRLLPPSIFHREIYVKKAGEEERTIESLSSGERQFYYMMSAIVYHMLNLSTISHNGRRIKYGDVCLVLDEIEICFHPDYQRKFLKWFVDIIVRMELNKKFGMHVIFTTHSPFLLSDIPKVNILSLENGKPKPLAMHDTFCANVYDLLRSPFFMKEYIGEFAADKLDRLVEDVNNKNIDSDETYHRLYERIDQIGDDFIRNRLHSQLAERYSPLAKLRDVERQLSDKLESVRNRIAEIEGHDSNQV